MTEGWTVLSIIAVCVSLFSLCVAFFYLGKTHALIKQMESRRKSVRD